MLHTDPFALVCDQGQHAPLTHNWCKYSFNVPEDAVVTVFQGSTRISIAKPTRMKASAAPHSNANSIKGAEHVKAGAPDGHNTAQGLKTFSIGNCDRNNFEITACAKRAGAAASA